MTRSQILYIKLLKRPIGFFGALLGLIVTNPITVPVAILLCFANKGGGIFFRQERPGKDGKLFKVIKFKSMTDERDGEGNLLPNEQRITKVGHFIRKTSIDELPQLINILKGDMAFIGPRPLMPRYLQLYSEEQMHRHDVLPGMTGWAQINGRNNITWTEKFSLDVWYVNHVNLALDIRIFFVTVKKVLGQKDTQYGGVSANSEGFNGHN